MHLYKHFWKLVIKNKFGIILYSIISIVLLIIVSAATKDVGKVDDSGNVDITESIDISYVDNDNSLLSKAFIDYLSKDNNVVDYSDKTDEQINDLLYFQEISFHIEIPEGFEANVCNDQKLPYRTSMQQGVYTYKIENIINSYMNVYIMYINNGSSEEEAIQKTNAAMDQTLDIKVYSDKQKTMGSNPKEYVIYYVSVYITYISFGMIAFSVGRTIITSNNEQVSSRVSSSPVSDVKRSIINSLGLYSFAIAILIVYIVGIYAYGGDTNLVKEKGLFIIINTLLVLLYNGSLTSIIASFKVKENTLSMLVNVIGISMSFLCGVFVPQWMLGDGVLKIAKILPFYWSVSNMSMIFPECGAGASFDIAKIYQGFGIQGLYVIVFAVIAILINKMKKQ